MSRVVAGLASGLVLWLLPAAAQAHGSVTGVAPFYAGLLHPVTVPAHLLALIAAGVLAGQAGWQKVVEAFPTVVLCIVLGLALARPQFEPIAGPLLLAAGAATGLAIAIEIPLGRVAVAAWCGVLTALVAADSPAGTGAAGGALAAASALVGTGLGMALLFCWSATPVARLASRDDGTGPGWLRVGVRVVGSWLTASAALALALAASGRAP